MRPSDWLTELGAIGFYPEAKLHELEPYGVGYDDGLLVSHIEIGLPYSTYGRLTRVPLLTERELMREVRLLGFDPVFERHGADKLVIGFQVITSVWTLVRPITIERPPSTFESDPMAKARLDLAAIRGYGY